MILMRLFCLFVQNGTASTAVLSFSKAIKLNYDCFMTAAVDEEEVALALESTKEFSMVVQAPTVACKLCGFK